MSRRFLYIRLTKSFLRRKDEGIEKNKKDGLYVCIRGLDIDGKILVLHRSYFCRRVEDLFFTRGLVVLR